MMTTVIKVDDKDGSLERLFAAERQELLNDRASYSVSSGDGTATITVEAQDATALRAVLNSVCKTLIVHEKVSKVMSDGSGRSDAAIGAGRAEP